MMRARRMMKDAVNLAVECLGLLACLIVLVAVAPVMLVVSGIESPDERGRP